jgi:hypothetical protein
MVVALVALLGGLSFGTGVLIFRHFKADASATSRLYSGCSEDSTIRGREQRLRPYCGWESKCAR